MAGADTGSMDAPNQDGSRGKAALSHLGVPFLGPALPVLLWAFSSGEPFVRQHARQAFAFQVVFFLVYAGLTMAAILLDVLPIWALPISLAIALALELPQIGLALSGRKPVRLLPGGP